MPTIWGARTSWLGIGRSGDPKPADCWSAGHWLSEFFFGLHGWLAGKDMKKPADSFQTAPLGHQDEAGALEQLASSDILPLMGSQCFQSPLCMVVVGKHFSG